jgi:hypothetical protein
MLFAYFGPETLLPVTSIVACVAGSLMMFGRTFIQLSTRGLRSITRRKSESRATGTIRPAIGRHRHDPAQTSPQRPILAGRHKATVETEV